MLDRTPTYISLALLLAACSPTTNESEAASREALPLVRVEPVEERMVREEIETTGYLETLHEVSVASKVAGQVTEVLVDEGDKVAKGQVLARIDSRAAEATKRATETQLEDKKVRAELAKLEVEAAGFRVEQARIERERTQAEYDRLASQDPDSVARKALEESAFARDSAIEAHSVAIYNQRKSELDHQAALNAIAELQAKLDEVNVLLTEHEIVAPIDGTIAARGIGGGEMITTVSRINIFVVVDDDDLVIYLSRPQDELPKVQGAKSVVFTVDGFDGVEFTAPIDLLRPVVDRDTGHFQLRARVKPEDTTRLKPGMFIRARILTEDLRPALMVPKAAVVGQGDRSFVFAVRDDIAHRIRLDPGYDAPAAIECRNLGDGGLRPDDLVIVAGQADLADQTRVELARG